MLTSGSGRRARERRLWARALLACRCGRRVCERQPWARAVLACRSARCAEAVLVGESTARMSVRPAHVRAALMDESNARVRVRPPCAGAVHMGESTARMPVRPSRMRAAAVDESSAHVREQPSRARAVLRRKRRPKAGAAVLRCGADARVCVRRAYESSARLCEHCSRMPDRWPGGRGREGCSERAGRAGCRARKCEHCTLPSTGPPPPFPYLSPLSPPQPRSPSAVPPFRSGLGPATPRFRAPAPPSPVPSPRPPSPVQDRPALPPGSGPRPP